MSERYLSTQPKPFVFVLMPFDAKFDDIYAFGIKGAADDAGAYAERVDEQLFADGILDRVFNQINKADVIVADMTDRNANVFYEVGYAHALDKLVVLPTQEAADIPFDLKHRPHIVYGGSIKELRPRLAERVRWAIQESRLRRRGVASETFEVRIAETLLGEGAEEEHIAVVDVGQVGAPEFGTPLTIRNVGAVPLEAITHVYLFTDEHPVFSPLSSRHSMPGLDILPSFPAAPYDAPDGLRRQFRLRAEFGHPSGTIPPGASEMAILALYWNGKQPETSRLRLRVHGATGSHDFIFFLCASPKPR